METKAGMRDGPCIGNNEPIEEEDSSSKRSRSGAPDGNDDLDNVLDKFLVNVEWVDKECSNCPDSVKEVLIEFLSNFLPNMALMRPLPYGGVTRWMPGRHGREKDGFIVFSTNDSPHTRQNLDTLIICGYLNLNDLETSLKLFNQMKNQDLNLKV